jgi:hypothetical protein
VKNQITKKAGYIWFLGLKFLQKPLNKPTIIGALIEAVLSTHLQESYTSSPQGLNVRNSNILIILKVN